MDETLYIPTNCLRTHYVISFVINHTLLLLYEPAHAIMIGKFRGTAKGEWKKKYCSNDAACLEFCWSQFSAADFCLMSTSLFMLRHIVRGLRGRGALLET